MTWRDQAACLGVNPELFFVGYGTDRGPGRISVASVTKALTCCARCPVRGPCLDYATNTAGHNDFGIWGGMMAPQRIELRRNRTKT